jgi:predicted  nucleic acid-binding Zn-ribbon protein
MLNRIFIIVLVILFILLGYFGMQQMQQANQLKESLANETQQVDSLKQSLNNAEASKIAAEKKADDLNTTLQKQISDLQANSANQTASMTKLTEELKTAHAKITELQNANKKLLTDKKAMENKFQEQTQMHETKIKTLSAQLQQPNNAGHAVVTPLTTETPAAHPTTAKTAGIGAKL